MDELLERAAGFTSNSRTESQNVNNAAFLPGAEVEAGGENRWGLQARRATKLPTRRGIARRWVAPPIGANPTLPTPLRRRC